MAKGTTTSFYVIAITVVATLGGFLFGFDSGVINGTVDGLQVAFESNSAGTGFNVASMLLGCAVGAFFAGRLADIFGRRALLRVTAVLFIVSAWGSGVAGASGEFVVYRILGGLAVGAASVMSPAYISEIAPAHLRGRLSSIQQVAIIAGLFIAFLSNYFLAGSAGSALSTFWWDFEAWRWMFWMELIPAAIFFIVLFLIPESPRFFVVKGRLDDARSVLGRLYDAAQADSKLIEIQQSLAEDHRPRLSDLIHPGSGRVRMMVWVGIGLAVLQQFVGINVVFYYGAVLWQSVGFSEADALAINVLSGAISIGAVLLAILLIDRIGRKPLLKWGSIGMAVTLTTVAVVFLTGSISEDGSLSLSSTGGLIALIAANAYVAFFNASWGPVMWVMLGEMFPNQMRGSGLAVSGLSQWLANFAVTITFPLLLVSAGLSFAYGLYAFFAVVSVWFVVALVQETKGQELEDMNALWDAVEEGRS